MRMLLLFFAFLPFQYTYGGTAIPTPTMTIDNGEPTSAAAAQSCLSAAQALMATANTNTALSSAEINNIGSGLMGGTGVQNSLTSLATLANGGSILSNDQLAAVTDSGNRCEATCDSSLKSAQPIVAKASQPNSNLSLASVNNNIKYIGLNKAYCISTAALLGSTLTAQAAATTGVTNDATKTATSLLAGAAPGALSAITNALSSPSPASDASSVTSIASSTPTTTTASTTAASSTGFTTASTSGSTASGFTSPTVYSQGTTGSANASQVAAAAGQVGFMGSGSSGNNIATTTSKLAAVDASAMPTNEAAGTAASKGPLSKLAGVRAAAAVQNSSVAMSGAQCLQQMSAGQPVLNSSQCYKGLTTSCAANSSSASDPNCQSFVNYVCGTGNYNSSLTTTQGSIQPGSGQGSVAGSANIIANTGQLPSLNFCQTYSAKTYCQNSAHANCLSCKTLSGTSPVTAMDITNAKLNCTTDPNYSPGLYDMLLSALPASSATASVPKTKSFSIIGANPNHF